jgi:hypothetical protein
MTSKHRLAAILSLGLLVGACNGTGAVASASPTTPIAVVPPPASTVVSPPSSAPSAGPSASAEASPSAQPTPGDIDPCTLLTQEEASTLMGKKLGAGVSTTVGPDRVCTFKSGLSEVKVFITPPASSPDVANAFYDEARSTAPEGVKIDDITIAPYARAGYGTGTAAGAPVSGLVVVDGNLGFEVYCGFPACSENASAAAAALVGGRLP